MSKGFRGRMAMAILAPLGVTALAYGLWWVSDRLLYIGPLDRAAFGWVVVIPVWLLAPVAAGFAWHRLDRTERLVAVVTVGILVTAAAATLVWLASAFPNCQYGARYGPADVVAPSLLIGAAVGGSLVVAALATTWLVRRDHPWWAVILGAATHGAILFVSVAGAIMLMYYSLGPSACERPPIT